MINEITSKRLQEAIIRATRRYGLSTSQAQHIIDEVIAVLATAPSTTVVATGAVVVASDIAGVSPLETGSSGSKSVVTIETPPPAGEIPVPPAVVQQYYYVADKETKTATRAAIDALIADGYRGPLMLVTDTGWKTIGDYGFVLPKVTTPADPVATAAPVTAPADPTSGGYQASAENDPSKYEKHAPVGISVGAEQS